MSYESEAYGYNKFTKWDQIQYRAMHKYDPAAEGDMGWVSVNMCISMVRYRTGY